RRCLLPLIIPASVNDQEMLEHAHRMIVSCQRRLAMRPELFHRWQTMLAESKQHKLVKSHTFFIESSENIYAGLFSNDDNRFGIFLYIRLTLEVLCIRNILTGCHSKSGYPL